MALQMVGRGRGRKLRVEEKGRKRRPDDCPKLLTTCASGQMAQRKQLSHRFAYDTAETTCDLSFARTATRRGFRTHTGLALLLLRGVKELCGPNGSPRNSR